MDAIEILRTELYSADLSTFFNNVLSKLIDDNDFFNELNSLDEEQSSTVNCFNQMGLGYVIHLYELPQSMAECIDDEPVKYVLSICDTDNKIMMSDYFDKGWIYYD